MTNTMTIRQWELTYRRADGHTSINWATTTADALANNRMMRSMGHTPIRARVVEYPCHVIRREFGNQLLLRYINHYGTTLADTPE